MSLMDILLKSKCEFNKIRLSPRGYLNTWLQTQTLDKDETRDITLLTSLYGESASNNQPKYNSKRTVVILSFLPLPYVLKMESVLGRFLADRGWTVKILTNSTTENLARAYHQLSQGFDVSSIEDFLSFENIKEINKTIKILFHNPSLNVALIKQLNWKGVPVGIHALATYLSGMPAGRFEISKLSLKKLRRILRRAMLHVDASTNFLRHASPALVIGMEKGFVGTCEMFYTALLQKTSYVQWVGCHEPNSIMFKRYTWESRREHPFSICEHDWAWIQEIPWSESYREAVMLKFEAGYKKGDWFKYKNLTTEQDFASRDDLRQALGLESRKKTAIIYSHILSDANLFYGIDVFSHGYEEWLVETVRGASENSAVNWVLKLHPANKVRNLRLGYSGEYGEIQALRNAFGEIPEFLHIVYPEDNISPWSFFQISDYGVTVRGTVGIELPCFGVPVLTAGTGRYSDKGFTYDSSSAVEYMDKIKGIHEIRPLTEPQMRLAILYAYVVFELRPAKYDNIFRDIYQHNPTHRRYRDIEFKLSTLVDVGANPQMQAILDFLEDEDREDFLDPEITNRLHPLTGVEIGA